MTPSNRFSLAARLVNYTGKHLFLTGRAGTGKTTFLRHIQKTTTKKTIVVAPTGVAAINAGGVTMHSMFHLPFGMYIANARLGFTGGDDDRNAPVVNRNTLFKNIRFNKDKLNLLRELELLVIDEVSMLRADALDAIDTILRAYRKRPHEAYGGVQVLFIGDLYQLPPVVTRNEEQLMYENYESPFFFSAAVAKEAPPLVLELDTIYRQTDEDFIYLLNSIRRNKITDEDMELLTPCYQPNTPAGPGVITLTTHNAIAQTINQQKLDNLPLAEHHFMAEIQGTFPEHALPVEQKLSLKIGAQVMFMVNDKGEDRRFFNGKIATVTRMTEDGEIFVKLSPGIGGPAHEEEELKLEKHVWKNVKYKYNEVEDSVDEEEAGTYSQYPLRLAWAITIHKSQGLTFERAVVDAGQAFAPGQVYVALSRLTNLGGLILHSKIPQYGIDMPEAVVAFCSRNTSEAVLEKTVEEEELQYAARQLVAWFSFEKLLFAAEQNHQEYFSRGIPDKDKAIDWSSSLLGEIVAMMQPAEKFGMQLQSLLRRAPEEGYAQVLARVEAAANWFGGIFKDKLVPSLQQHYEEWAVKKQSKKYLNELRSLETTLLHSQRYIQQALLLAKGLAKGGSLKDLELESVPVTQSNLEAPQKGAKVAKGETSKITLDMWLAGKTIAEIAATRNFAESTIEGHLASSVTNGLIKIEQWLSAERIITIKSALEQVDLVETPLAEVKTRVPEYITFAEIRTVRVIMMKEK